ncbi:MAG: hypothetical protein GF334_03220 [Candidatus Altiarchaeales archaeon]|nr:hypothetical protein [Candidatus Altiarchaeales archaeon]
MSMSLTEKQVIEAALEKENDAYLFYKKAAEKVSELQLKVVFEALSKEEQNHIRLLKGLEAGINVIYESPTWIDLFSGVKSYGSQYFTQIKKILEYAIEAEGKAEKAYRGWADQVGDSDVKRLCQRLAGVEAGHKSRLKSEYTRIQTQRR